MKIFKNKGGSHLALWLEHDTLKKQSNLRWDSGLVGVRGGLEPSKELMMGSGFCLALSPAAVRSVAFLWILRVICNTFVVQRGKGSNSLFSSSESHPPHKVAQERGGRRLWQQED